MPLEKALRDAETARMDLVEVSPNLDPPVVKIMNLGKFKYNTQKRKHEAKKRLKQVEVKEIKVRPNIDKHDYEVKLRATRRFIGQKDKVKVTLRFRGREMAHLELGHRLLKRILEDVEGAAKLEQAPKLEGRQMVMVLGPL